MHFLSSLATLITLYTSSDLQLSPFLVITLAFGFAPFIHTIRTSTVSFVPLLSQYPVSPSVIRTLVFAHGPTLDVLYSRRLVPHFLVPSPVDSFIPSCPLAGGPDATPVCSLPRLPLLIVTIAARHRPMSAVRRPPPAVRRRSSVMAVFCDWMSGRFLGATYHLLHMSGHLLSCLRTLSRHCGCGVPRSSRAAA